MRIRLLYPCSAAMTLAVIACSGSSELPPTAPVDSHVVDTSSTSEVLDVEARADAKDAAGEAATDAAIDTRVDDTGLDVQDTWTVDAPPDTSVDTLKAETFDSAAGRACTSPADCRLYSDYCDGCNCRVLAKDEPNPKCSGTKVSCLVDPCRAFTPTCKLNVCGMSTVL